MNLQVQTQRLEKVVDFTSADFAIVEAGMTKTSRWLRGHSKPVGDTTPFPSPDDLQTDFDSFDTFCKDMTKRRS